MADDSALRSAQGERARGWLVRLAQACEIKLPARGEQGHRVRVDRGEEWVSQAFQVGSARDAAHRRAWLALASAIAGREYEASDLYEDVDLE